jgi:hypothetical protein
MILCLDAGNTKSYPGSGTTWFDISGNNNHFTLYNGPSFNSGVLTFDGSNDYARSNSAINFTSYSYVIVDIFVKTNSITGGMMYEVTSNWNTQTGGFGLAPHSNGNTVTQDLQHTNHNTSVARNYSFVVGTNWANHVNLYSRISDATGRLTYGNGSLINFSSLGGYGTGTSTAAGSFPNDFMYIATRGGTGSYCPCSIGQIKVYGIKYSASEILENFYALRGRFGI